MPSSWPKYEFASYRIMRQYRGYVEQSVVYICKGSRNHLPH